MRFNLNIHYREAGTFERGIHEGMIRYERIMSLRDTNSYGAIESDTSYVPECDPTLPVKALAWFRRHAIGNGNTISINMTHEVPRTEVLPL